MGGATCSPITEQNLTPGSVHPCLSDLVEEEWYVLLQLAYGIIPANEVQQVAPSPHEEQN